MKNPALMKSLRLSLAFVASMFVGLALPQAASAQFYERILPIDEILYAVEERGFEPISRPELRGDVYVVEVIDPRGRRARLSVDAFDGVIIGSVRPRIIEPAPIYREALPLQPFGGRVPADRGGALRVFPDGSVRDLRDPSTRGLTDPGSSVRIERVIPRDSARAAPDLPESAPLPPVRPQRLVVTPDAGGGLPRDAEQGSGPARRALPEAARAPEAPPPTPEVSERQRSVIERTTPVPRSTPLRSEARAQTPAQQVEREVQRAPTPRGEALLDEFSPDEIDQMDMYPARPRIR
jgi:hypothetical protein